MVFKERTKDSMLLEGHISCLQARYEVKNQNQLFYRSLIFQILVSQVVLVKIREQSADGRLTLSGTELIFYDTLQ